MTPDRQPMAETIETKLSAAFTPESIQVIDESEQHRGHGGWREGGETHFKVVMRAGAFNDLSRVDRSRRVHAVLKDELSTSVHALALDLSGTGT